ncbi:MAG TPA: hypothetical protein VJQ57_10000 [Acidimicrobiia bacterium]|nr:hypothetical protein [Acidimicrobiia bacterium]
MPVIPSGYCQANLRFGGAAAPLGSEITMGFEVVDFGTESPEDVANTIADAYTPNVMTRLASTLILQEVYVKFGPNDVGPSGSAFRTTTGADAGQAVPPNTAAIIRKATTLGGRRGNGRLYQPGLLEAQIDAGGNIAAGYVVDLQTEFDDFLTAVGAGGLNPVVLHGPGISSTPAPSPVTAFIVQGVCGTQRDRMRR